MFDSDRPAGGGTSDASYTTTGSTWEESGGSSVYVPSSSPTKQFPPKANFPPELPSAQDLYEITSENGQVIPIAFGRVRIAPNLIERGPPVQLISAYADGTHDNAVQWWQPYTAYLVGQCVQTDGGDRNGGVPNFYVCTQAGTSGSGQTTTYIFNGHPSTVTDGSCVWSFIGTQQEWLLPVTFAFCEGPIQGALKAWIDKAVYTQWDGTPGLGALQGWKTLALGATPQTRPSWAGWNPPNNYPDTYAGTAVLWWYGRGGQTNNVPQLSLEIDVDGGDANPADIASTLITHARKGAGWSSSRLYTASFDGSAASWHTYCQAAGLTVSWVIDAQSSVLRLLETLCTATQTDLVVSGGRLKFVPRCDRSITGNGVTFTPQTAPVYDLGSDDLLAPLSVSRISSTDTFNAWPVEYYDRDRDYGRVTVDDPDMSDVDVRGYKPTGATSLPLVISQGHAVWLSRTLAQRSLNCRNSYSLRLAGWRYCLLEPTDALTVTDPVQGITRAPIRIVELEETLDADGASVITIGAEDYPAAAHSPALYATEAGDGYKPNTSNAFDGIVIGADQIGGGAIPVSQLTSGATENLWPNPTSENEPPSGADLSSPEWAWRSSGSAYAGNWKRSRDNSGGSGQVILPIFVPCAPGDSFYVEAMTTTNGTRAGVWVDFLDAAGSATGTGTGTTTTAGTWTKCTSTGTAPSGTVTARIYLFVDAGGIAYWDAIYARRMVAGSIVSNDALSAQQTQSRYGIVWSGYPYTGPGSAGLGLTGYGFNSVALNGSGYTGIYEAIIDVTPPAAPAGTSLLGAALHGTSTVGDFPGALGSRFYSVDTGTPISLQMTGRTGNQIRFKVFSGTSAVDLAYAGWAFNIRVDYVFG